MAETTCRPSCLALKACSRMEFETALLGLLAELEDYSTSEAWETCLACGCLCKPFEPCPGCEAARQALTDVLVNTT